MNQLPVVERGRLLGAVTREQLLSLVQAQIVLGVEPARRERLRAGGGELGP